MTFVTSIFTYFSMRSLWQLHKSFPSAIFTCPHNRCTVQWSVLWIEYIFSFLTLCTNIIKKINMTRNVKWRKNWLIENEIFFSYKIVIFLLKILCGRLLMLSLFNVKKKRWFCFVVNCLNNDKKYNVFCLVTRFNTHRAKKE